MVNYQTVSILFETDTYPSFKAYSLIKYISIFNFILKMSRTIFTFYLIVFIRNILL